MRQLALMVQSKGLMQFKFNADEAIKPRMDGEEDKKSNKNKHLAYECSGGDCFTKVNYANADVKTIAKSNSSLASLALVATKTLHSNNNNNYTRVNYLLHLWQDLISRLWRGRGGR